MNDLRYEIEETISNLDDSEIIALHNEYCQKAGYMDDYIYSMCFFSEEYAGKDPLEVAQLVYDNDFNPNHSYYYYDGLGNITSVDLMEETKHPIDIDAIVNYIADNETSLYNSDIQDILDEYADVLGD